jgi:carbamoyl-phosphate synthase small subunit
VSIKKTVYIEGKGKRVAVVDLGGLKGFISQISGMGFEVVIVPYDTTAADILKLKPKGIVISSGPENDPGISPVINAAKGILGKVPVLGISLGHQVIAQALGARLTKMKLGHRGVNYPVKRQGTNKGEITVQNHSFSVDEKSLKERSVEITERNLNDKTIEKLKSKKLKFVSVQYYPVSPGSGEINPLFGEFKEMIDG